MNYTQLLVLCTMGLSLLSLAMENPKSRAKFIEEIGNGTLTATHALERIEAICKDDIALKAYVQVCIPGLSRNYGILSGFLEKQLTQYREQSADAQTREVIDVMVAKITPPWTYLDLDPFYVAAEFQKEKAVTFFRELNLKPSFMALNMATNKENVTIVKNLVEAGAPFEDSSDREHALQHHPLKIAATRNNQELVDLLAPFCDLKKKYSQWIVGKWAERNVYESIQAELQESIKGNYDSSYQESHTKALALLAKYYKP